MGRSVQSSWHLKVNLRIYFKRCKFHFYVELRRGDIGVHNLLVLVVNFMLSYCNQCHTSFYKEKYMFSKRESSVLKSFRLFLVKA